jgi:hypothetical protein
MQVSKINTTKYVDDKYQIKLELVETDARFSVMHLTLGDETVSLYSYYAAEAVKKILTEALNDFNGRG